MSDLLARLPRASGFVKTVVSGSDVGPYTYANGLKIDSTGAVVVNGMAAARFQNGLPFDTSDEMAVTTAPVAPKTFLSSLQLDANKSLCISVNSPVTWQNGLPFDANGFLCCSNAPGGLHAILTEGGLALETESGSTLVTET